MAMAMLVPKLAYLYLSGGLGGRGRGKGKREEVS